jgi:DNA-binding transcriptional LysR family regulator
LNDRWVFESEQGREVINVKGLFRANDIQIIYDAALQSLGIAQIPDWVIGSDISESKVEWLLKEYYSVPIPIRFIYPQTRYLALRARYFIDFIIEELADSVL